MNLRDHPDFGNLTARSNVSEPAVLTLNCGSSSLKFAIYRLTQPVQPLYRGGITAIGSNGRFEVRIPNGDTVEDQAILVGDHEQAFSVLLEWLNRQAETFELIAAGHRIVHGGERFHDSVLITDEVIAYLETLVPLAPNHQPNCLQGVVALRSLRPDLRQVACFDTAFHRTRLAVEQRFALPERPELRAIRRYGFHGLSYEYIVSVLPAYLGEKADGRIVVMHLGYGASLCAIQERRSVATTMTFTPLDGVPMGTRCGSLDPGVILYLLRQGMQPDELTRLLYFESGLLGISGVSGDMATLLDRNDSGPRKAIEQFVHYTVRAIGSLAAALEGLDAVVFTAGIGEHAAPIRAAIGRRCEWLGLDLDEEANSLGNECISRPGSRVQAWIIPTDEESVIAEHIVRLI